MQTILRKYFTLFSFIDVDRNVAIAAHCEFVHSADDTNWKLADSTTEVAVNSFPCDRIVGNGIESGKFVVVEF